MVDAADARGWIAARELAVRERLADIERRLAEVRAARVDWTDEEHDPEGFTLTFEWQQAEGARNVYENELRDLERARTLLDAGAYGVCTSCGRAIPPAQLELRPARTTCVSCAEARPGR